MRRYAVVLGLLLWVGLVGFSQEKEAQKEPPEFKIPSEDAQRQNPVKPSPISLAQGKKLYGFDCAMCHGKEGDGKGDLAGEMGLKLRDYRDPASLKEFTDGELFYILAKGKGKMPGDEERMKPDQRWQLVNYIRSMAKKGPATQPKQ